MSASLPPWSVAVAFSNGAEVSTWRLPLSIEQMERLERALSILIDLGHVAAFGIEPTGEVGWAEVIDQLRSRCGSMAIEASLATTISTGQVKPSYLMPIWLFDHEINGAPASTGQFLDLDLELIATPSSDEEVGALLPGRNGRWLIHARPLGA